jgi:hypothetical protein
MMQNRLKFHINELKIFELGCKRMERMKRMSLQVVKEPTTANGGFETPAISALENFRIRMLRIERIERRFGVEKRKF